ncbi:Protein of unknown function (DUF745) [Popillia japonica]|uniref:Uncharacterized protein n=1 Tax=Popillia japonica TaxID=7064 RepID=A0AAW1JZK3_POPJA
MKLGLLTELVMVTLILLNYSSCRRIKNATVKLRGGYNIKKHKTYTTDRNIINRVQNFAKAAPPPHKTRQNWKRRKLNRDNSAELGTSVKTFYLTEKFLNDAQIADKPKEEEELQYNPSSDNTDDDEENDSDSIALDVVQKFVNDAAASRKAQQEANSKLSRDSTNKDQREKLKPKPSQAEQKFAGELNIDSIEECEPETTKNPNECDTTTKAPTLGIAQKAANDAAAAHEAQQVAAQHASQQVRLQLADKALVSANAAEAAVVGKEAIVEELEDEIGHVVNDTKKERCELAAQQAHLHLTLLTEEGSKKEVAVLNKAMETAITNERNAQQVSQCAQDDLLGKQEILTHIRCNTDLLKKRLEAAKIDLENTKKIVHQGCMEAYKAKADVENDKERKAVSRKTKKNRRMQHYYKTINIPMSKYITF